MLKNTKMKHQYFISNPLQSFRGLIQHIGIVWNNQSKLSPSFGYFFANPIERDMGSTLSKNGYGWMDGF